VKQNPPAPTTFHFLGQTIVRGEQASPLRLPPEKEREPFHFLGYFNQEQGRPQLGIDWGSQSLPLFRAFQLNGRDG